MMTLDQAIESAKILSAGTQILGQQQYEMLTGQLKEEEQYSFAMALVDLNIGPRTGRTALQQKVAEFLSQVDAHAIVDSAYTDRNIENRLVRASMQRDAQWLQKLKDKFTQWWEKGPEDEFEEEFGEAFPFSENQEPGMDEAYGMEPVETIGPGDDVDPLSEESHEDDGIVAPEPEGPPDFEPTPSLYIPEGEEVQPSMFPTTKEVYQPTPDENYGDEGERKGMPPMLPVDSANLESIGYDEEEGLLYIVFKAKPNWPRTLYRYDNVSPGEYSGLLNPPVVQKKKGPAEPSHGVYFNQNIRNKKPYTGPLDPSDYGV